MGTEPKSGELSNGSFDPKTKIFREESVQHPHMGPRMNTSNYKPGFLGDLILGGRDGSSFSFLATQV